MKKNVLLGLIVALPLLLLGCGKKDTASAAASEAASSESTQVSASQQAAIDSLDKPNPEAIQLEDQNSSSAVAASAAH